MKKIENLAKILFLFFAVVSLGLVTVSCSDDDDDEIKAIKSITMSPETESSLIGLLGQNYSWRKDLPDESLLVISNTEDFHSYFGSEANIDIDFDQYTLLCGWVIAYSTATTIESQNLTFNKKKNSYIYSITLNYADGGYQVISSIYFCALYNKLSKKVELEMHR